MSTIVDQLRTRISDHAVDLATTATQLVVEQTQQAASRRTGALAEGITGTQPALAETQVRSQITSAADYSLYQDEGTGIYGPSGARIFPTSAKALRFDWPAAGGIVFAKSIAGSPGTHFWAEPLPERWHNAIFESAGA